MENDYSHLEGMVHDVTNLDTARMTLRWALERLAVLDRKNRDLEEDLRRSRESQAGAEKGARDMEARISAQAQASSGRETFYRKLEEMVAALSEGKVDLAGIAKREADLDQARQKTVEEYRSKLEELERSHREMMSYWADKFRQIQSYEPRKLSEALVQYDEFRRHLEQVYQERFAKLEKSVHEKEEALLQREREMEANAARTLDEARRLGERQRTAEWERQQLQEQRERLEACLKAAEARVEEQERLLVAADRTRWEELSAQLAQSQHAQAQRRQELETLREENQAALERRTREIEAQFADRGESLRGEYESRLAAQKAEGERIAQRMREEFEVGEKALLEEISRRDAAQNVAQEESRALRESADQRIAALKAEFAQVRESLEKRHQEEIEREKHLLRQELDRQNAALEALGKELKVSQDRLAQNHLLRAKDAQAVRAELTAEFRQVLEEHDREGAKRLETARKDWAAEREGLLEERQFRDAQIESARGDVAQLRQAMDAQRRALELDFAGRREALEEEQRGALQRETSRLRLEMDAKDAVIEDIRKRLSSAQEEAVRGAAQAQEALEAQRTRMTADFQRVLRDRSSEEATRLEAFREDWDAQRRQLEVEKDGLRQELSGRLERFRTALEEEYRNRAQVIESQAVESRKRSELQWEADRESLRQELSAREAQLQAMRQELLALDLETNTRESSAGAKYRESLARQQEQGLQVFNRASDEQRQAYEAQLRQKDDALRKLEQSLKSMGESLAQGLLERQALQELLRTQLTEEFQSALKLRAQEEVSRLRAATDRWESERAQWTQLLSNKEAELEQLRARAQSELHAMKAVWTREREEIVEKFEEEYRRKQSTLLEACEQYRQELEARERALEGREKKHG